MACAAGLSRRQPESYPALIPIRNKGSLKTEKNVFRLPLGICGGAYPTPENPISDASEIVNGS